MGCNRAPLQPGVTLNLPLGSSSNASAVCQIREVRCFALAQLVHLTHCFQECWYSFTMLQDVVNLERYQYLQDCIALMDSCRAIHSSREPDERISWCALQRGRLRKRQVVNRWPTCRIQQILSSVRLAGDDYENIAAPRPRANNMSSLKAFPRATYLAQDVYLASPCWV